MGSAQIAGPWATVCKLRVEVQERSRPGPPDAQGTRWMERESTGLALAYCNCGYTSGRVSLEQLAKDIAQHGKES